VARTRTRSLESENNTEEQEMAVVSDSRRRRRRDAEAAEETTPSAVTRKDRPTPSARQIKPRGLGTTGLVNRIPVVRSIVAYLRGVASELQKVTWPTREETTRLTAIVLGVTLAFSIGLGLLDVFLGWWFHKAFSESTETLFLIIAGIATVVSGAVYMVFRKQV